MACPLMHHYTKNLLNFRGSLMRILYWAIVFGLAMPVFGNAFADDKKETIRQLDWLVGKWHFEDNAISGSYSETGTRICEYTLDDAYILCTSEGENSNGNKRSYVFLVSYNWMAERFEIIGLFGDFPRKILYALTFSPDSHHLELNSEFWTEEGLVPNNEASIVYDGKDQYVWTIRSGEPHPETGIPAASYRDTVTRIP